MDLTKKSINELRALRAEIDGELAAREGCGIEIWNGVDGDIADYPKEKGAILDVFWAIARDSYQVWFPLLGAAKAALLRVASDNGRSPDLETMSVDLTASGCLPSGAMVIDLS